MHARRSDRWRLSIARFCAALLLACALLFAAACQSEDDEFGSEGAPTDPIDLGSAPVIAYDGTVGTTASSYYKVTVVEESLYNISLTDLLDDADLIVFADSAFTQAFCVSARNGNDSEACSSTTGTGVTILYIQVKPFSETGTSFRLSVN